MPPKRKTISPTASEPVKIINIAPSDLAWLCGMDHYNNLAKCLCKIWKQVGAETFKQVRTQVESTQGYTAVDSAQKQIAAIQTRHVHTGGDRVDVLSGIKAINADKAKTAGDLVAAQANLTKQLSGMDHATQAQMTRLLTSATNVMHGVHNENNGLAIFTAASGLAITGTQGAVRGLLYKDPTSGVEWRLSGKYDGLAENGDLVEVKNRQKGLFRRLRDYEECQIQAYLNMLNIEKCHLVEVYKAADGRAEYNVIPVARRPEYMAAVIQPWIEKAARFMGVLAGDQGLMAEVMSGDTKGRVRDIYNAL